MDAIFEPFDFSHNFVHTNSLAASQQQQQSTVSHARVGNSSQRHLGSSLPASTCAAIAPSPAFSPGVQKYNSDNTNGLHIPNNPAESLQNSVHPISAENNEDFRDFLIESQDVDMSILGLDMLPWFDAPSGDLMPIFDNEIGDGFVDVDTMQKGRLDDENTI